MPLGVNKLKNMKRPASISLCSTLLVTLGIFCLIQLVVDLHDILYFWKMFIGHNELIYFIFNTILAPLLYIMTGIGIQNGRQLSRHVLLVLVIATYGLSVYRSGIYIFQHTGVYFYILLLVKLFVLWQLFFAPAAKYFTEQKNS